MGGILQFLHNTIVFVSFQKKLEIWDYSKVNKKFEPAAVCEKTIIDQPARK